MKRFGWRKILGSPVLLILLLLATPVVAALWYRADAAQKVPAIGSYDWSKHPNVLLISSPPDDCGCGASTSELVTAGLKHNLAVLVIASKPSKELNGLKRDFAERGVVVNDKVSEPVLRRFSPRDKVTTVLVQDGRMVRKVEGGYLEESFFAKE